MPNTSPSSWRRNATWAALLVVAIGYTYWQLKRLEQGQLFALALSWDRPPFAFELADAKRSAQSYLMPAIMAVAAIVGVLAVLSSRLRLSSWAKPSRAWKIAATLFLLAALADLVTTLRYFHQLGVYQELHPGIRLFGYAYGLTAGPVAGKLVQAMGVLALSLFAGRAGILLLGVVTLVYAAAAIHNYVQMLA